MTAKSLTNGARDRYLVRWREDSLEQPIEALVHGRLQELAPLADLDGDDRDAAETEYLRRLRASADRIGRAEEHLRKLRDDRDVTMIGLALLGVRQSAIAAELGLGAMVVARAIGTSARVAS